MGQRGPRGLKKWSIAPGCPLAVDSKTQLLKISHTSELQLAFRVLRGALWAALEETHQWPYPALKLQEHTPDRQGVPTGATAARRVTGNTLFSWVASRQTAQERMHGGCQKEGLNPGKPQASGENHWCFVNWPWCQTTFSVFMFIYTDLCYSQPWSEKLLITEGSCGIKQLKKKDAPSLTNSGFSLDPAFSLPPWLFSCSDCPSRG